MTKRFWKWLRRIFSHVASIDMRHLHGDDYMAYVTWSDGRVRHFRGSCTVWHEFPSGRRAGTGLEYLLAQAVAAAKWGYDEL